MQAILHQAIGNEIITTTNNVHQEHGNNIVILIDGNAIKIRIMTMNSIAITDRIEIKETTTGVSIRLTDIKNVEDNADVIGKI